LVAFSHSRWLIHTGYVWPFFHTPSKSAVSSVTRLAGRPFQIPIAGHVAPPFPQRAVSSLSLSHVAVGRAHRPWYDKQRPPLFAEALRAAKKALDPHGLFNPGVLIDP